VTAHTTTAATVDEARKTDRLTGSIASDDNVSADAGQQSAALLRLQKQALLNAVAKMPSEGIWRKALPVHPAANKLRPATPEEIQNLAGGLKRHGQLQPVVLTRINGGDVQLLDGRTRLDVQEALGVKVVDDDGKLLVKFEIVDLPDDNAALAYVLNLNLYRRHLSSAERRQLVKDVLAAMPEASNRQIGKIVGLSHPAVAAERKKLEAKGDVEKVSTSTDTAGRKQPRKRKINKVREAALRKLTKRQLEQQEGERRRKENADLVIAVLIERLGRDGLVLVRAAMSAVGVVWFEDATDRQIRGTPDERLVNDCRFGVDTFVAKFGKPEPAVTDAEASAAAMKARFAGEEAAS
jgi:ParB-like chromosome segregation protein Spo0J